MGRVVLDMTMSLDGFIAGPGAGVERPMGEGGLRLHKWLFEASEGKVEDEIARENSTSSGPGRPRARSASGSWGLRSRGGSWTLASWTKSGSN